MKTETPRTDARQVWIPMPGDSPVVVPVDFARQLERELNEVQWKLANETAVETCTQCQNQFSPSWIESGWCILCILKERTAERDQALKDKQSNAIAFDKCADRCDQWRAMAQELAGMLDAMHNKNDCNPDCEIQNLITRFNTLNK